MGRDKKPMTGLDENSDSLCSLLDEVEELERQQEYVQAERLLTQALLQREESSIGPLEEALAEVVWQLGRDEEAVERLLRARQAYETANDAESGRRVGSFIGDILVGSGDQGRAVEFYLVAGDDAKAGRGLIGLGRLGEGLDLLYRLVLGMCRRDLHVALQTSTTRSEPLC